MDQMPAEEGHILFCKDGVGFSLQIRSSFPSQKEAMLSISICQEMVPVFVRTVHAKP